MKMKRIMLLFAGFIPTVLFAQLQDVVASSGGSMSAGGKNMSFTLGEVMITTLSTGSAALTQGFQQPGVLITGIYGVSLPDLHIAAYPNPVRTSVYLVAEPELFLHYKLYDMNGILIEENFLVQAETAIDFENLTPAVYVLKVYKDFMEVKSFKIVKR